MFLTFLSVKVVWAISIFWHRGQILFSVWLYFFVCDFHPPLYQELGGISDLKKKREKIPRSILLLYSQRNEPDDFFCMAAKNWVKIVFFLLLEITQMLMMAKMSKPYLER